MASNFASIFSTKEFRRSTRCLMLFSLFWHASSFLPSRRIAASAFFVWETAGLVAPVVSGLSLAKTLGVKSEKIRMILNENKKNFREIFIMLNFIIVCSVYQKE